MGDQVEQFREALSRRGIIVPGEIIADGRIHRCDAEGKNGKCDAAYLLHLNGIPAGGFQNWRDGEGWEDWHADVGRPLTEHEQAAQRAKVDATKREHAAEEARRHAETRKRAAAILNAAHPATADHPYLQAKGVRAHGLRLYKGALVIPICDLSGELHSLQFIAEDGTKRFLTGGRVRGCYFAIGKLEGTLCITEGYATGASIFEATGYAVAVAFDAGNLEPVARDLRAKLPDLRLILCADDDAAAEGNPGLTKATAAARAVGGLVAVPDFGPDRPDGVTDFNDLALHQGAKAVRACIEGAQVQDAEPQRTRGNAPKYATVGHIAYRRASEVQAKPIRWLWKGRIARGKVSMLAGNPGLGKSQLTASMAAIVSTGGAWPVDRTRCEQGNVIFLSAEDDAEDTIRPRLEAAGADLSRVFILDAVIDGLRPDGGETVRAFNLKVDLARLAALIEEIGDVALIVIDPITAYLGDTDSHINAEVRALLAPMSEMAAKAGAAVVCVSHLNKGGNSEAMMRVTGSLAFVAAARAAFLVTKDQEDGNRRLFLPMKNNVANDQTGLAFAVHATQVPSPVGPIETARIVWEAEPVTVTADEAMAATAAPEDRTAAEEAETWLSGLVAEEGGKVDRRDVMKAAHAMGFKERTVQRAREKLGLVAVQSGFGKEKRSLWTWPDSPNRANAPHSCQARNSGTNGEHGTNGAVVTTVEVEL